MAFSTSRPLQFNFGYTFVFLTVFTNLIVTAQTEAGCENIRNIYRRKGFSLKDVPTTALQGEHKGTCGAGFSCCTTGMEQRLTESCGEEFESNLYEASFLVRDSYVSKAKKFDDYFVELLDNSEKDFSTMFEHTYGDLYKDHEAIFSSLYADLRSFYQGKNDDLESSLDDFFGTLLQKMYLLLNPGRYSDEFMTCIADHMHILKPFGTIPDTLTTQMRRSLNAARTYVQGLDAARDIITKATKESPVTECKAALVKMEYCQSCKEGSANAAPCDGLCTNIMKACLAQQAELADEWTKYIDAMKRLGERMSASFNIETIIDSINVKISEGIMNYQENTQHVSDKVLEECGQHISKRSADGKKKKSRQGDWSKYRPQANGPQTSAGSIPTLNTYIVESDKMLSNSRDFWTNLPYMMCSDDGYASETSNENCWTGVEIGIYNTEIVNSGLEYQIGNPEVDMVSTSKRAATMEYQALLKAVTAQLNNAYNGKNTIFIDTDDEDYGGSGSGSGSGSGDIPTDVVDHVFTSTTIDSDPKYRPTRYPPPGGRSSHVTSTLSLLLCSISFSRLFRSH
ncbi:glypican-6-like [Anneissia japonica]|uniref:glypican-6-like n=1 Tax=Anneissia japonica TaxID=1529436 RepID=UPI0014257128|nr:glypican-6-like [Anneissia japonica]